MTAIIIDHARSAFSQNLYKEVEINNQTYVVDSVGLPYCGPHGYRYDSVPQFDVVLGNDRREPKLRVLFVFTPDGVKVYHMRESGLEFMPVQPFIEFITNNNHTA